MVKFFKRKEAGGQFEQPSLRQLTKKRILDDVLQHVTDNSPGWKILVVDNEAMKVISSAVGMYEMMDRKIKIVESLERKRAPFPDNGVVYIMHPSEASIGMLLQDYKGKKPLYGKPVFIYFLSRLPDHLLNTIKSCKPLLKRIKGLSEMNLDFICRENRAFSLDMHDDFSSLFKSEKEPNKNGIEKIIADKLVTVCATMNEYPHIRYPRSSTTCSTLAQLFEQKMKEYISSNSQWWFYGGGNNDEASSRERGVLLLVDRRHDCVSPLMHDFSYQAMVRDLIGMEGDQLTLERKNKEGEKEKSDILLNEKDEMWVELRGKHIAEVFEDVKGRIDVLSKDKTEKALHGGGEISMAEITIAMKNLDGHQDKKKKIENHLYITQKCMANSEQKLKLALLEQEFVFGSNEEGGRVKLGEKLDAAETLLKNMKDPQDQLRLILILTITQGGLSGTDRRRLENASMLRQQDLETIYALEKLGVSFLSNDGANRVKSYSALRSHEQDNDDFMTGARYIPIIKSILFEMLVENTLSFDEYPSVQPMPEVNASTGAAGSARRKGSKGSARRKGDLGSKWNKAGSNSSIKNGNTIFTGGRTIVFFAGGVSYSEICSCREFMASSNREIVVGSTALVNAEEYMENLSSMRD